MVVVKSEIDSKIKLIQEWIKENKHLPQKIGKITGSKYILISVCCLFLFIFLITFEKNDK